MTKTQNIIRYQNSYCKLSANSLDIITKQQIRINNRAEISIKSDAKLRKYYQISTKLMSAFNSLAMNTKQQITTNDIQEISLKIYARKIKYYPISKKLL